MKRISLLFAALLLTPVAAQANLTNFPPPKPTPIPEDDDNLRGMLAGLPAPEELRNHATAPTGPTNPTPDPDNDDDISADPASLDSANEGIAWPDSPILVTWTVEDGNIVGLFAARAGDERALKRDDLVPSDPRMYLLYASDALPDRPFALVAAATSEADPEAGFFLARLDRDQLGAILRDEHAATPGASDPAKLPKAFLDGSAGYAFDAGGATVLFGLHDGEVVLGVVP
ncbi:MAG: hypothetical protein GY898_32665 [Proteobacteria bacterium]|nr:hypothetical protein [Pseudomonadota bacterium]